APLPALASTLDSRHGDVPSMAQPGSAAPSRFQAATKPGQCDDCPGVLHPLPRREGDILREQHLPDVGGVRVGDQDALPEAPLPRGGLLGQDVPLHGLPALDLPGRRELEALHGRALALQLQLRLWLPHSSFSAAGTAFAAGAFFAGALSAASAPGSFGFLGFLGFAAAPGLAVPALA